MRAAVDIKAVDARAHLLPCRRLDIYCRASTAL